MGKKKGLLKIQNRISFKGKRNCVHEVKYPPPIAIRRPKEIDGRSCGRWAMCPSNKKEEDGRTKTGGGSTFAIRTLYPITTRFERYRVPWIT